MSELRSCKSEICPETSERSCWNVERYEASDERSSLLDYLVSSCHTRDIRQHSARGLYNLSSSSRLLSVTLQGWTYRDPALHLHRLNSLIVSFALALRLDLPSLGLDGPAPGDSLCPSALLQVYNLPPPSH